MWECRARVSLLVHATDTRNLSELECQSGPRTGKLEFNARFGAGSAAAERI